MTMLKIRNFIAALRSDERGLTAVEYAVLGAIVVAAIAGIGSTFGTKLTAALNGLIT